MTSAEPELTPTKLALRRTVRAQREGRSPEERERVARSLAMVALELPAIRRAPVRRGVRLAAVRARHRSAAGRAADPRHPRPAAGRRRRQEPRLGRGRRRAGHVAGATTAGTDGPPARTVRPRRRRTSSSSRRWPSTPPAPGSARAAATTTGRCKPSATACSCWRWSTTRRCSTRRRRCRATRTTSPSTAPSRPHAGCSSGIPERQDGAGLNVCSSSLASCTASLLNGHAKSSPSSHVSSWSS